MFRTPCFAFALLLLASSASHGQTDAPGDRAVLADLAGTRGANTMALTPNGRRLLVGFEKLNRLAVFDVATGRQVAAADCPAPRSILCRGDKVWVASYGHGTISAFTLGEQLKPAGRLNVPRNGVFHLAAGGEHFDGKIFAVCDTGGADGRNAFLADTATGRVQAVGYKPPDTRRVTYVTVSWDGRHVFAAEAPRKGVDGYAANLAWPIADFVAGKPSKTYVAGGVGVHQVNGGDMWFDGTSTYVGFPPKLASRWLGMATIPDCTRPLIYSIGDGVLQVRRMNAETPVLDELPISLPTSLARRYPVAQPPKKQADGAWSEAERSGDGYRLAPSAAVTLGETTYLLLLDLRQGVIYRAVAPAIKVPPVPAADDVRIPEGLNVAHDVPTEHPPSQHAFSSDGRRLILRHRSAKRLSLWDIASGRRIKTVEIGTPTEMLVRDGRVFVVTDNPGQLAMFSDRDLRPLGSFSFVGRGFCRLSAAGGSHFDGRLLANIVTATRAGHSLNYMTSVFYIDTKEKKYSRARSLRGAATVAVDYTGRYVHEIASDHRKFVFDWDHYPSVRVGRETNPAKALFSGYYQVAEGPLWFVRPTPVQKETAPIRINNDLSAVLAGFPPTSIWSPPDSRHLGGTPDHAIDSDYYYLPEDEQVQRRRLNNIYRVAESKSYAKQNDKDLKDRLDWPAAVTLDGTTHFFAINSWTGKLAHLAVKFNRSGDSAGGGELPPTIVTGKPVQVQLFGKPTPGDYALVNGPDGIDIGDKGLLTWTPTANQLGSHRLKVRAVVDGKTSFLRLETAVGLATGGDNLLARFVAPDLETIPVLGPEADLCRSADGNANFLLQGRLLFTLSPDGKSVVRIRRLPHVYTRMAERKDYFVMLALRSVDLLDKQTLRPIKQIPLNCVQAMDLAIHPIRPVCYVATTLDTPGEPDVHRSHMPQFTGPIAEVDESAGRAKNILGIRGSYVAVDDAGRHLVVYMSGPDQLGLGQRDREAKLKALEPAGVTWAPAPGALAFSLTGRTPKPVRLLYSCFGLAGKRDAPEKPPEHPFFVVLGRGPTRQGFTNVKANLQTPPGRHYQGADQHPSREVIALTGDRSVAVFCHPRTGRAYPNLAPGLDRVDANSGWLERVKFTADGEHILVWGTPERGSYGTPRLLTFELDKDVLRTIPLRDKSH